MSENKVLFDPGFAPLVEHFSGNISVCDQIMSSLNSLHQKKFKFKILYPQIMNLIENNVSFYYGCLLWAFCIVNQNKNAPAEILNNSFLDMSEADLENYDYNQEIDFLIEYFKTFERDSKYYLGKSLTLPPMWIEIINIYKEFLVLNKGFVNVRTTEDIVLPEKFTGIAFKSSLCNEIQKAIDDKNIQNLLNINIIDY